MTSEEAVAALKAEIARIEAEWQQRADLGSAHVASVSDGFKLVWDIDIRRGGRLKMNYQNHSTEPKSLSQVEPLLEVAALLPCLLVEAREAGRRREEARAARAAAEAKVPAQVEAAIAALRAALS
jgi:hypothetical protein